MAARIRTVYSKWRVGADDSVRPDDDRTISDRADRVVDPNKGAIDDVPIQAAGCGHPALRNGHR